MHLIELIGTFGGAIGLIQSLPQIIKIWKSKEHSGVSTAAYIFFLITSLSWFTYGLRTHSVP
jgi:uncharacterized protein with PQ loop repeat